MQLRRISGFKLPKITISDIADRSKADFLSKLIAILQTTWFLLHCIARGHQRLALTELELVTMALCSLNAVTYVFWWHKPLGVQEPMRIYFTEATPERHGPQSVTNPDITASYVISKVHKWIKEIAGDIVKFLRNPEDLCDALLKYVIVIPFLLFLLFSFYIFLPFPLGIILLLKILKTQSVPGGVDGSLHQRPLIATQIVLALRKLRLRLTSYIARISERWLRRLFDPSVFSFSAFFVGWLFLLPSLFVSLLATTIFLLPFFTLLSLVSFIFTAVFGIITSTTVAPGATHVPSFYAVTTPSDKYSRMVVFAVFGVIFGGLHCIGWNFEYPTPFEQHLWRTSSLAITVIPFIVGPIDYLLEIFKLNNGRYKVLGVILDLVMTILLFVYVSARISLIAQALALLRHQPQTAFLAVDWTKYIPHIF